MAFLPASAFENSDALEDACLDLPAPPPRDPDDDDTRDPGDAETPPVDVD